jgi:hypothetical protein
MHSLTFFFEIITGHIVKRVLKNAHRCTKNTDSVFGSDVLGSYHKDSDNFSQSYCMSDETCVSFVNVETKVQ